MNPGARLVIFLCALVITAPAAWRVMHSMPTFGAATSGYADTVNTLAPPLRHVSNMVAAVNFDIRGFDTLGEETMLLCAVVGAVMLLRGSRGEQEGDEAGLLAGRADIARSDATTLACRVGSTALLLFGTYVVLHGTVTPGGGFQGGVIASSALLLLYLGEGYRCWRDLIHSTVLAALEGIGALVFVAAAAWPLAQGHPALDNLLPLGKLKDLYSGGVIFLLNGAVGLAVTGSFGQLILEFLEETRSPEDESEPNEADT
ncbi:MAG TPA: MnhB domain-containing protein [Steroidobacteraceae bacterium]|nr:MnhB domain-containing protein [Steroidobacteraceae bacterium]